MSTYKHTAYSFITSLRSSTALVVSLAASAMLISAPAHAVDNLELPTGGNVVGGSASLDYSAPGQLDVNQGSDRLVVDWNSFNIGRDASTTFNQPGSNSLAVNRVTGNGQDPTQILGTLKANGRVMVLDKNGVVFGRTARVDVGGLVASTGDVSTAAVMNGDAKLALNNMNGGEVANEGTITVSEGGLAALVAPSVRNSGVINAKLGRVSLGAGEAATVDLYGDKLVEMQLDETTSKAVIEHTGTINAEGGVVQMTAQAAKNVVDSVVNMDGIINASSVTEKGGRIVLGGDTVNVRGTAKANGTQGGTVLAIANEKLTVSGTIQAHGAAGTGFVDTSAPELEFTETASVTSTGDWLIDPLNITIGPVLEILLEIQLNLFGNAIVATPAFGPQPGNIFVERTVNWTTANSLTLNAINDIRFSDNDAGFVSTGGGAVNLNAGRNVWLQRGSGVSTSGGNITVNAQRLRIDSGVLNAGGANIDINNTAGFQSIANALKTSGTGTIDFNQYKDANAFLSVNTIQNAVDAIDNTGTGLNTLFVGTGTWTEDLALNVANLRLRGNNFGTSGSSPRAAETVIAGTATAVTVTAPSVTVDGVKVSGGVNGVTFDNTTGGTLTNTIVTGQSGWGVRGFNADGLSVTSNKIHNTGAQAVLLTSDSDSANVSSNEIYSTGAAGIHINGGSDASTVSGNKIGLSGSVNGDGILIEQAKNASATFTVVSENEITGTLSPAINYGSGVHVRGSKNVVTTTNTIYNTGWDGVRLFFSDAQTVVSNNISNVHRTGVYAEKGEGVNIISNIINGANTQYGIDVFDGGTTNIIANDIDNTKREGINLFSMKGNPVLVAANQIDFTGANGILADSVSNSQFLANLIGLNGSIKGDGIQLKNTSNNGAAETIISGNTITNTLSLLSDFGNGVQVLSSKDASINGNIIYNTGWDGVRVEDGTNISAAGNDIDDAARTGVYFEKVTGGNIDGNFINLMGWYGVDVRGGGNLNITGNTIDDTGKEGINAEQVGSSLDVVGNTVTTTGSHGISVKSSNLVSIMSNTVGSVPGAIKGLGIFVSAPGQLDIGATGTGNTVTNTDKDGIFVDGFGAGVVSIVDNNVSESDTNGIGARNVDDLTIADNTVKDVAAAGVRIIGSYYGNAVVSGNEVTDADVGMLFESGLIDLTGASNKLTGGSVGYRFAPVVLKGGFSQVDLKDDTIGTTEFTGQSTFYVELLNGALFAPGAPTLEDGLNATYDGFTPSSVGGILTALQYNALENMFWHFVDDNTVGLFFFGSAPDIQQNRIFRQDINNFIPDGGNAGFTIAGLPSLPGGGPTLPDLNNPADLNNLAPQAGGGQAEGQELTPEELAALAPAAGGQEAPCWGDAVNLASNGQVASYDFTTDPFSALEDANACGSPNN